MAKHFADDASQGRAHGTSRHRGSNEGGARVLKAFLAIAVVCIVVSVIVLVINNSRSPKVTLEEKYGADIVKKFNTKSPEEIAMYEQMFGSSITDFYLTVDGNTINQNIILPADASSVLAPSLALAMVQTKELEENCVALIKNLEDKDPDLNGLRFQVRILDTSEQPILVSTYDRSGLIDQQKANITLTFEDLCNAGAMDPTGIGDPLKEVFADAVGSDDPNVLDVSIDVHENELQVTVRILSPDLNFDVDKLSSLAHLEEWIGSVTGLSETSEGMLAEYGTPNATIYWRYIFQNYSGETVYSALYSKEGLLEG